MNSYKELILWQKSINLVEEIYKTLGDFPPQEKYCLVINPSGKYFL